MSAQVKPRWNLPQIDAAMETDVTMKICGLLRSKLHISLSGADLVVTAKKRALVTSVSSAIGEY